MYLKDKDKLTAEERKKILLFLRVFRMYRKSKNKKRLFILSICS